MGDVGAVWAFKTTAVLEGSGAGVRCTAMESRTYTVPDHRLVTGVFLPSLFLVLTTRLVLGSQQNT